MALALLSGCAATGGAQYRPLIDSANVDAVRYEGDLYDCQAYARQVSGAQERAVVGALFGALLGAAVGHGTGYGNRLAALGALSGAAQGGVQGNESQQAVITRCLSGRGYSVLQ